MTTVVSEDSWHKHSPRHHSDEAQQGATPVAIKSQAAALFAPIAYTNCDDPCYGGDTQNQSRRTI